MFCYIMTLLSIKILSTFEKKEIYFLKFQALFFSKVRLKINKFYSHHFLQRGLFCKTQALFLEEKNLN